MKHLEFWQGQRGLDNLKPKRIGDKWESSVEFVTGLVGEGTVVEVGCGTGRFSRGFTTDRYIGVDINKDAIDISRKENPGYQFEILREYSEIPKRDVMLLHSIALHVPDDEIEKLFAHADKRIVLAETMGTRTKRTGKPNENLAFHYARTSDEYAKILKDWNLVKFITSKDPSSNKMFTYMVFERK